MWREQVEQIGKIRAERNRKLNAPANGNELSRFREAVVEKFGEEVLPQQYCEFLQTVNGIEFNGLKIYGIDPFLLDSDPINQVDSFFDANETWEDIQDEDELMFLGDSDIAWYCYNVSKQRFVELDKPSGELMETFPDFAAMLESAFLAALR
ncbi:YrhA family protein [Gorillibacterium sp. CAU 1737]|uniref:YrhA family protein n=1 Tax=Gorillibacterium sp. CAU 1737 TaxID=3140362 RepID=UPI003260D233